MKHPSHRSPCDSQPVARQPQRALTPWFLLLALACSMSAPLAAVAASDAALSGTPNPYGKSRFGVAAAKAPLARDVSVLGAYPPATPLNPERIAFPSVAASRTPEYPPSHLSAGSTLVLPACGVFQDCSFEAGGLGWFGADILSPLLPLGVYGPGFGSGSFGFFLSAPTDGGLAVLHGFDGSGPGIILVGQDVILQPNAARLEFDYRAAWDMFNYGGSTLPRTFEVQIQPSGGGPALQSTTVLTAIPGTVVLDTGDITGVVDISSFAGQAVRVVWLWTVPESYTGPGLFQLDRIAVRENTCVAIDNCSFETGALPGWSVVDLASPLIAAAVRASGSGLIFNTCTPTDGGFAFTHGWDGGGPGDIRLYQDVSLPAGASSIEFDYRAGWDMGPYGATLPRTFGFDVEPSGGGAPLFSQSILTASPGTVNLDTGPRNNSVDLTAFAGQSVRLVFRWNVPENFTGPADFQLDHIRVTQGVCASIDNCSFETGSFPAWTTSDLSAPYGPIQVVPGGAGTGFFVIAPTDGGYALYTGWDGNGPGTITAHQDVTIPLWAELLRFDYRAGWIMDCCNATLPRTFGFEVQPSGGGAPLFSQTVLTAEPGTQNLNTGPLSRAFPVGAFAGQPVRLVFLWTVPENFTGPAAFQLDRIKFDNNVIAVGPGDVPALSLELRAVMPNPSRAATMFAFTLPQPGDVELEIMDVRGARVWSARHADLPAGEHRLGWSGLRAEGSPAAAGVYYARVRTSLGTSSRKFVRVQ